MAEQNLIKSEDLAKAREIEFTYRFSESIKKLVEALGVTRKIPKQAGTVLKAYKAKGTLQDGKVGEGEIIPLSKYQTVAIPFDEVALEKWRKATTAEAIIEKGYEQAVMMTTDEMLKDVQKGIRKYFFDFLKKGEGRANGTTFQAVLAQAWGQLQVLFEDDEIQAIYFMNPLDVADYLATASISTQTAFGLTYVENFLGLGTVIFNSSVPKGQIYATAKDNLVLYYIPVNGADMGEAFSFTSDQTGLIGIHEIPDYKTMTVEDVVTSGIFLFAERIDGVIVGEIGGAEILISLDEDSTEIAVGEKITLNAKVAPAGTPVTWTSDQPSYAAVTDGVVEGKGEGSATITAKAGNKEAKCTVTVSSGA